MKPVWMQNRHEPPTLYGDCLRACVASILELEVSEVPHFHFDGHPSDAVIRQRLDEWLATRNLTSWCVGYHGHIGFDDLCVIMETNNPGRNYILFGATDAGDPHAVVMRDGRLIHDPSPWQTGGVVGPFDGVWSILQFSPIEVCYE